jgi:hypothetical protein
MTSTKIAVLTVCVKLFFLIEQFNVEVSFLRCALVVSHCTFSKTYISVKLSECYNLSWDKQHGRIKFLFVYP